MITRILVITLLILSNVSCSNDINELNEESLHDYLIKENFSWIRLDEEHSFISNQNDTLSFEIVDEKNNQESGGSSVGAPTSFNYTTYFYKNSLMEESQPFLKLTTSSDNFAELTLCYLNGTFDLITENNLIKSPHFKFHKKYLNDVIIVRSKEIKDFCATKVWWSRSQGIVQFITTDGKQWIKIQD